MNPENNEVPIEKLEALYLAMAMYTTTFYQEGFDNSRKDRISNIIRETNKMISKLKPKQGFNKSTVVHWINYYRDMELDRFNREDDYSPEVFIIYIIQYLVSEHNYRDLKLKYSQVELLNIIKELELKHRKLCFKTIKVIGEFLDAKSYIYNK